MDSGREDVRENSRMQGQNEERWGQVLRGIIHREAGTLSEESWNSSFTALYFWKRQDLNRCFQILDRLVQEEGKASNGELTTDHLNEVIQQWSETLDSNISSKDVLRKLKTYRAHAPELFPDSKTYNMILDAAVNRDDEDAHEMAEKLVDEVIQNVDGNPFLRPNTRLFTTAIQALAKGRVPDAPQRAEALFARMRDMSRDGLPGVRPNQKTYNALLQAWCSRGDPIEAAPRAERLLMEMPVPNAVNFAKVLKLWRLSNAPGSSDRMLSVFALMKERYKTGNGMVKPTGYVYGEVLRGLSYDGQARQAETILQELIDLYEETDDPTLAPKREYFTSLIYAWSKSGESDAPQRAENILQLMQDMARRYESEDMQPDATSFNCTIHAYAQSGSPEAYRRASFILRRMWDLHEGGMPNLKPNHYSYMFVLDALVKSKQSDAALKATSLLRSMHARRLTGDDDLIPTTQIYNAILELWAKSGLPSAPEEAELLLDEMEALSEKQKFPTAPNLFSYNLLCRVWERSGRKEGVAQCHKIFLKLKSFEQSGWSDLAPNDMTFNVLLEACSQKVGMAQALLETMCRDFLGGESKVKPTIGNFNTVIKACVHRQDLNSISSAEAVYTEMKKMGGKLDVKPDTTTFNTLMYAWCVTKDCDYSVIMRKITEYQNDLLDIFNSGDLSCTPTGATYNPMLRVLLYSKHPDALEQSLSILADMKANDKLPSLPDRSNYYLVLRILRDQQLRDKAQRSWELLQEMIERGLAPTDRHFDTVINTCARAGIFDQQTHEKAFDIALATLRLMLAATSPTQETFIHFFHTAAGLDKQNEVQEIYNLCCKYECEKGDSVRRAFHRAVSPHLLSRSRKEDPEIYDR
jgi:PPR repeat